MKQFSYFCLCSLLVIFTLVTISATSADVAASSTDDEAGNSLPPAIAVAGITHAAAVAPLTVTPAVAAVRTSTPPPPAYCDNIHAEYPAVVKVKDLYYAYYSGFICSWNIFYATSSDGVHFDKQGRISISDGWASQRAFPFVIYEDGIFKLWYGGGLPYQIGYAESSDGVNFTARQQPVVRRGTGDDWDSAQVLRPSIVELANPTAAQTAPFGLPANISHLYLMYYNGFGGNQSAVGLAYSSDGISWRKYANNPVFTSATGIYTSFAITDKGKTYLYYHTEDGIYLATSGDGINFVGDIEPILSPSTSDGWDAGLVYGPFVRHTEVGNYAMYYNGIPGANANFGMVGLAISDDLVHFRPSAANPVLTVGNTPANFTATANPNGSITASWHMVVSNADSYQLRYGTTSQVYTSSLDVSDVETFSFTPPSSGDYYLTIVAITGAEEGHPAAEQHVYVAPAANRPHRHHR